MDMQWNCGVSSAFRADKVLSEDGLDIHVVSMLSSASSNRRSRFGEGADLVSSDWCRLPFQTANMLLSSQSFLSTATFVIL